MKNGILKTMASDHLDPEWKEWSLFLLYNL